MNTLLATRIAQNAHLQVVGRELYKLVMTIMRNYELSRKYEDIVEHFTEMSSTKQLAAELKRVDSSETRAHIPDLMTPETTIQRYIVHC